MSAKGFGCYAKLIKFSAKRRLHRQVGQIEERKRKNKNTIYRIFADRGIADSYTMPAKSNRAMKNKFISAMAAMAAAIILVACGADKEFRIDGRIDGFGTGNLRLVYYNGEGVQSMAATAVDGRFMVTGRLNKPAMMRIYTNNGVVVGASGHRTGRNRKGRVQSHRSV